MSATAIIAIRAAIRIGKTAADAFDQYAQEKPILIPDAERVAGNPRDFIAQQAQNFPEFERLLNEDPELKTMWVNNRPVSDEAGAALEAVAYRFLQQAMQSRAESPEETSYGILVTQWASGKGPVSPFARVVVSMADVALEYVAGNPQVLGIGGDGEKLVGAIAGAISTAIPDATTRTVLGPKDRFAERLAALALHSGLKTVSENPALVLDEAHLQVLIENTLTPIVTALDTGSVTEQVEWRRVTDALLGPAISAALTSVAENPTAFLGDRFNSERAAGVMAVGLLRAAAETGIKDTFTEEGLKSLGRAAIAVAADHPEVVLGDLLDTDLSTDLSTKNEVALNLFRSIANTLKDRQPPYKDELGVAIAVAAIDGLKQSARVLIKDGGDWNDVIVKATEQVLDGFSEALGDDGRSIKDTVFSEATLVDLARIVLDQVGRTPHLVAGDDPEVGRIIAAISKAMVADDKLLLTSSDWTRIIGVAVQEAALNPGRLFGINQNSMEGKLAADIIGRILQAAGNDLVDPSRAAGPVLIGETLREAVIVTLRAIAGNVKQAFDQKEKIGLLATKLTEAVSSRGLELGGKEWLHIFRALLPDVLNTGTIPELSDAAIAALLGQ